jgi:hypothetical protein
MEANMGDINCSVVTWCKLVDGMSPRQRGALSGSGIECMLDIQPIKMRTNLLRYLIQAYEHTQRKFVFNKDKKVEFTVSAQDVYSIFGFPNRGLNIFEIVHQEGKDAKTRVPENFLNRNTENIVINELIHDIIESGATDDVFLQKVVLVLISTVLAPSSRKIVNPSYYCLVENVDRIKRLNWNAFTLEYCLECLSIVKEAGKVKRQWPNGNLALIQVSSFVNYLIMHCNYLSCHLQCYTLYSDHVLGEGTSGVCSSIQRDPSSSYVPSYENLDRIGIDQTR